MNKHVFLGEVLDLDKREKNVLILCINLFLMPIPDDLQGLWTGDWCGSIMIECGAIVMGRNNKVIKAKACSLRSVIRDSVRCLPFQP